MSDILPRAEAMMDEEQCEYEHCKLPEMIGELVDEIKRLRELGKISLDFYVAATLARHRNFQLLGTALEWIDEAERLEEQLIAKDATISQYANAVVDCNSRLDAKDIELARWQEIAIDAQTKVVILLEEWGGSRTMDVRKDLVEYRERAAEELNLQVTQEAGYVERLEIAFVEEITQALELIGADSPRQTAQAALTKIREGKP